jgi:hypothetical protein
LTPLGQGPGHRPTRARPVRVVYGLLGALLGLALVLSAGFVGVVPAVAHELAPRPTAAVYAYDSAAPVALWTSTSLRPAALLTHPVREGSVTVEGPPTRFGGFAVAAETGGAGTSVFWSGGQTARGAAEKWALENGGTTLEMTPAGRAVESATQDLPWSEAKPMWDQASSDFTEGASGTVHVFQNAAGVSLNSLWRGVEYPPLVRNGVNMVFHTVGEGW